MKRKEIDHIPLDLVVEILTRLPAKSLMKFKCVSKLWLSIIRSQGFIDSFNSISSTRPRFVVALTKGIFCKREEHRLFFFLSSHEKDESYSLVTDLNMSVCNNSASWSVSVHGFMTCSLLAGFMIYNPSTRQFIVLPTLPDMRGTCLGYDPVDDQFKALSLISSRIPNHGGVDHMVLTLKGDQKGYSWRQIKGNNKIPSYSPVTMKLCINGVVYYGAWTSKRRINPVIVCFHVRSEKITFIKAPVDFLFWDDEWIMMEYKGKLASIVRNPHAPFHSFDLWVLEDVEKHEWSRHTCLPPLSMWDFVWDSNMSFPGTNKVGEIIIAPTFLSRRDLIRPFYIFYYNVETRNIRRVRLEGIADDQEFGDICNVSISPQHVENIRFL